MRSKKIPPNHQRGLATISAIMLMAVVATAVTTMSWQFHADAKRTKTLRQETQLQHLIHAGMVHAMQLIANEPDIEPVESIAIPLPASLSGSDAGVSLALSRSGDDMKAQLNARLHQRTQSQTLHFSRTNDRWQLVSITSGRMP